MTNVRNDLIGLVYGYLTVTNFIGRDKCKNILVEARCECGSVKQYSMSNLRKRNHTRSCGCHKAKVAGDAVRTHGRSGKKNPLYLAWSAMKRRCYNANALDYARYGGVGVRVCDEWVNDFDAYFKWCMANGWKKGMNIDKDLIPKKLGIPALLYSPEMCSVITNKENQNNRKNNLIVECNGEWLTLSQVAAKYNVKYHLLWNRYVKRKWDLEKAITTPVKNK